MSEEKVAAPKRATKKVVVVAEVAKPSKAAAAPAKAVSKAPATATKVVTKAAEVSKPKKAAAAPKAASTPTAKPVAKAVSKAPAGKKLVDKPAAPSAEERQRWIATAAYHRAEKRGFATGYEVQDWFDAEVEIDELVGKA